MDHRGPVLRSVLAFRDWRFHMSAPDHPARCHSCHTLNAGRVRPSEYLRYGGTPLCGLHGVCFECQLVAVIYPAALYEFPAGVV